MKNLNSVKFSFLISKSVVKDIVVMSLDHDVCLIYPQLKNAPDNVKIKGVCPIGEFEAFLDGCMSGTTDYLDRIQFIKDVKYKVIELDVNPVELPAGAEKEETKKAKK